jgi:hypothetical protein
MRWQKAVPSTQDFALPPAHILRTSATQLSDQHESALATEQAAPPRALWSGSLARDSSCIFCDPCAPAAFSRGGQCWDPVAAMSENAAPTWGSEHANHHCQSRDTVVPSAAHSCNTPRTVSAATRASTSDARTALMYARQLCQELEEKPSSRHHLLAPSSHPISSQHIFAAPLCLYTAPHARTSSRARAPKDGRGHGLLLRKYRAGRTWPVAQSARAITANDHPEACRRPHPCCSRRRSLPPAAPHALLLTPGVERSHRAAPALFRAFGRARILYIYIYIIYTFIEYRYTYMQYIYVRSLVTR